MLPYSLPPSDDFDEDESDWYQSQDEMEEGQAAAGESSGAIQGNEARIADVTPVPQTPPRDHRVWDGLGALTSSGPRPSTPVIGTPATRKKRARAKGMKKRLSTLTQAKTERIRAEEAAQQAMQQHETAVFKEVLQLLKSRGVKLGSFLLHVFNPQNKADELGTDRWLGFLSNPTGLETLLGYWTSKAAPSSIQERMQRWATNYVGDIVAREGEAVTRSGILRSKNTPVTRESVMAFDLRGLYQTVKAKAVTMTGLLNRFATTTRQRKANSPALAERKEIMIAQSTIGLLHARSRANNLPANVMGLYLYATGAQRQTMSMLSHLGLTASYSSLVWRGMVEKDEEVPKTDEAKEKSAPKETTETKATGRLKTLGKDNPVRRRLSIQAAWSKLLPKNFRRRPLGLLPQLARSCMRIAREVAKSGFYMAIYDNINMVFKAAEQIVGRKDSQENGTCVTIVELHKATREDLLLSTAKTAFAASPPLKFRDVIFTSSEETEWHTLQVHSILWIIASFGGEGFERFRTRCQEEEPQDPERIELHKTKIFPVTAHNIDESSITGNIEVVNTILEDLGLEQDSPEFEELVRLFAGDQLSIARLRSIMSSRAGHEKGARAWHWPHTVLGLFHGDMTATHSVLETHWGKPNAPASLSFHNNTLDRKPIVLTSMPPYRTCRDLVYVSLYARVLHCLLLVSKTDNLEQCAASVRTWEQSRTYAAEICARYVSTSTVESLRDARSRAKDSKDKKAAGDMVFENSVLFMRDALELRTLSLAIKSGRSGHVFLACKRFALSYRGSGHTKYAHEMLHLIHNLTHVWPAGLRSVVLNNWLVNPTGHKNSWLPVDLLQEHLNFWIKRFYMAQGSNASWEWVGMISPCVEILRQLTNRIHESLGSRQGKKHAPPDLSRDIAILMGKLAESAVYTVQEGRTLEEDEPAVDIVTRGLQSLTEGNPTPLADYNKMFLTLQRRRRIRPLEAWQAPADAPATQVAPHDRVTPEDNPSRESQSLGVGDASRIDVAETQGDGPGDSDEESDDELVEEDEDEVPDQTCGLQDDGDVDLYPDDKDVDSDDEVDPDLAALMDDSEDDVDVD